MSKKVEALPPGCERRGNKVVRLVPRQAADGSPWEQVRPVALTLAEAKLHRFDYYHPELGWIREGYKLERDRPESEIMADASASGGIGLGGSDAGDGQGSDATHGESEDS